MPFVKLDCGILNSTTWVDKPARDIFITALLMAKPWETQEYVPQLEVRSLEHTGWEVPPGRYGFVEAAGTGICRAALVGTEEGLDALERLGAPDLESRTRDHEGRRLVRVEGGFIVMNFDRYRAKDGTAAERSKRYRERQSASPSRRDATAERRDGAQQKPPTSSQALARQKRRDATAEPRVVTQAEAEAEAEQVDPRLQGDPDLSGGNVVPTDQDKSKDPRGYGNRQGNTRACAREPALAEESQIGILDQRPKGLNRQKHPDEDFVDNTIAVELGAYVPSPWLMRAATDHGLDAMMVQRTLERYRARSKLTIASQSSHDKAFKGWLLKGNFADSTPPPAGEPTSLGSLSPEQYPDHFAGIARVAPWDKPDEPKGEPSE